MDRLSKPPQARDGSQKNDETQEKIISHTVDAAGLKLRLWQHPPAHCVLRRASPNILFLHGYYDTGRSFDAIASNLNNMQSWCLDFRGHGQSDPAPPGGSYHLLDHVKDTFYVVKYLEKQNIKLDLIVAHSMGGNIALMLAGAVPGISSKLMLLDSVGGFAEDPREQATRLGNALHAMFLPRHLHVALNLDDAVQKLMNNNPLLTETGARRMAEHALIPDPHDPNRLLFAFDPRLRGPAPQRYSEESWRVFCERVKGPVKILQAEHGYPAPDANYLKRLKAFENATLEVIPNVGHHLHVDAPEIVANRIHSLIAHTAICRPRKRL